MLKSNPIKIQDFFVFSTLGKKLDWLWEFPLHSCIWYPLSWPQTFKVVVNGYEVNSLSKNWKIMSWFWLLVFFFLQTESRPDQDWSKIHLKISTMHGQVGSQSDLPRPRWTGCKRSPRTQQPLFSLSREQQLLDLGILLTKRKHFMKGSNRCRLSGNLLNLGCYHLCLEFKLYFLDSFFYSIHPGNGMRYPYWESDSISWKTDLVQVQVRTTSWPASQILHPAHS